MGLTTQEILHERDDHRKYSPKLPTANDPYPEESDGHVCQCCLSDGLTEDEMVDDQCKECTDQVKCEHCENYHLSEDLENGICEYCTETLKRERQEFETFEKIHGYGQM